MHVQRCTHTPIPIQLVPAGKLGSGDHTLSLDLGHDDKGDGFSFVKTPLRFLFSVYSFNKPVKSVQERGVCRVDSSVLTELPTPNPGFPTGAGRLP